ncbi:MAG: murein L,D-transpeptidase catalytic domain family protein [Parvularculaceae bacterium]
MSISRRGVLRAGISGLAAGIPLSRAYAQPQMSSAAILSRAREFIAAHAERIAHHDYVALVDYGAPSWKARFHLANLTEGFVDSFLVAHGRGSDPGHTGWLKTFSNKVGSKASSRGAYVTSQHYHGKYGQSIRLEGLDSENSNAERRAIVIHPAWYVGDDMVKKYGKLGRSEGCFALSKNDIGAALTWLGPGRLLYAAKF